MKAGVSLMWLVFCVMISELSCDSGLRVGCL